MNIINLTSNDVSLIDDDGNVLVTYEATNQARVRYTELHPMGNGLPVYEVFNTSIEGLPEFDPDDEDTCYIVPSPIAHELQDERWDLLFPIALVRDGGRVIGCRKLLAL